MRNLLLTAMTGLSLILSQGMAFGFGRHKSCCEPTCCTPCATPCETKVEYVDKVVTCYKPVTTTKTVTETHTRPVCRNVTTDVTEKVLVLDTKIIERTTKVPTKVKKMVPSTVCETVMQQVECVDPCTGCKTTVCKPVSVTKTVMVCHEETVDAEYKYKVKVANGSHEEARTKKVTTQVVSYENYTTSHNVTVCEMVPYQTTVKVPVCTTACGGCESGCGCGH